MSSRQTSHRPSHASDSDSDYERSNAGSPSRGHRRARSVRRGGRFSKRDDDYFRQANPASSQRRREGSLVRREPGESEWDTDYDPKDKYYLSSEEDPHGLYAPERKGEDEEPGWALERRREPPERDEPHPSRPKGAHRQHGRHHHHHDNRRDDSPSPDHRKVKGITSGSASTRPARPGTTRAGSSFAGSARPRAVRARSGHTSSARPRTTRAGSSLYGGGGKARSNRAKPPPLAAVPWQQMVRCAVEAGAVTALKVRNDPGGWGAKGTKIATAALGAAVVDTLVAKKMPNTRGGIRHAAMRQVAEGVIGSLLVQPAAKQGSKKVGGGAGGRRR